MGPMLLNSGSFGIKLVDNDHHDELRILYFGPRGVGGGKTARCDSRSVPRAQNLEDLKKNKRRPISGSRL
jgi:hypothetical protein